MLGALSEKIPTRVVASFSQGTREWRARSRIYCARPPLDHTSGRLHAIPGCPRLTPADFACLTRFGVMTLFWNRMCPANVVPVIPCRILAVHEGEAFQSGLRAAAAEGGHVVTCISSLSEIVPAAISMRPDIIVLNLSLRDSAGRDGRDALKTLRDEPKTAQIPVLGLSEEPTVNARLALELGAEAVLTSPFDPSQVVSKVERIVLRTSSGKFPAMGNVNRDSE